MASINTSPEAMDRMINNLTRFNSNLQALMAALKSDYNAVGLEWQDPRYNELGEVLNDAAQSLKSSSESLETTVHDIQRLKSKLEEYLSQRIHR